MTRLNATQRLNLFAGVLGAITLTACLTAGAQTAPPPVKKTTPVKKVVPPPPVAKAATAAPVAKTATPAPVAKTATPAPVAKTATPAPVAKTATTTTGVSPTTQPASAVVIPASSQTVLTPSSMMSSAPVSNMMSSAPVSGIMSAAPVSSVLGSTPVSGMIPSTAQSGLTQASGASNNLSSAGDPRAPVAGQGVGTFVERGWTLTAYGCFRTGTRLFCDFDVAYQTNLQANANIWRPVNLVDDGGKITDRHNAFFVGDDGSQFPTAYITSQKPVRFIVEYDDVGQRYTSISLVYGKDQIQGVPITQMDPSQPAGTIPARASTPGAQPATGAKGMLNSVENAVQPH